MIDEAIGKILGMAMAYGVSAMGLFLAYVNYRKRTLKADKIMTPGAWTAVAVTVLAVVGAVVVVMQLAQAPPATSEVAAELPAATVPVDTAVSEGASSDAGAPAADRPEWPLVGILVPASIFFLATWLTAALHRRFSQTEP